MLDTGFVTVTVHVAVLPLAEVAVIVAVPLVIAVTFPEVETVATDVLELFHVTLLLSASVGL